jgi:hypothetical protein
MKNAPLVRLPHESKEAFEYRCEQHDAFEREFQRLVQSGNPPRAR